MHPFTRLVSFSELETHALQEWVFIHLWACHPWLQLRDCRCNWSEVFRRATFVSTTCFYICVKAEMLITQLCLQIIVRTSLHPNYVTIYFCNLFWGGGGKGESCSCFLLFPRGLERGDVSLPEKGNAKAFRYLSRIEEREGAGGSN